MGINKKILYPTCLCFILLSIQSVYAIPQQSPAGGNYLTLDESHDSLRTDRAWFSLSKFKELTVEMWLYIDRFPDEGIYWSIIGQEGRFEVAAANTGEFPTISVWNNCEECGCANMETTHIPVGEWIYVVATFFASSGIFVNGQGDQPCVDGGNVVTSNKVLRIGGVIPKGPKELWSLWTGEKLQGYIDELRISSVVRYTIETRKNLPNKRFEVDKDTICLWHFDEKPDKTVYVDVSGNGYDLHRDNVFAVQSQSKLSTTWAKLKR